MADVLMIAGKPETIFKARDFEYLVEKYMGYEAAKYFREYAEKADEEVKSAKAGENTDLASYEADLESNHRAFQDIQTEAAVMRWSCCSVTGSRMRWSWHNSSTN